MIFPFLLGFQEVKSLLNYQSQGNFLRREKAHKEFFHNPLSYLPENTLTPAKSSNATSSHPYLGSWIMLINSLFPTQMSIHCPSVLLLFPSKFIFPLFEDVISYNFFPPQPSNTPWQNLISRLSHYFLPSLLHQQFPSFHWTIPCNLQIFPSTHP